MTEASTTEGSSDAGQQEQSSAAPPEQYPADHPLVTGLAAQKEKNRELAEKLEKLTGDYQALTQKHESLEKSHGDTASQNLRLQVAVDKGVPAKWVPRLQGSTAEELAADADDILSTLKPDTSAPKADPTQGGTGQQTSAPPDPNALIRAASGR